MRNLFLASRTHDLNAFPTATLDSGNPSPVNLGDTVQVNLEANEDFGDTIDGWLVGRLG